MAVYLILCNLNCINMYYYHSGHVLASMYVDGIKIHTQYCDAAQLINTHSHVLMLHNGQFKTFRSLSRALVLNAKQTLQL